MKRNQSSNQPASGPVFGESFEGWRARVAREQAEQETRERFARAIESGAPLRGHGGIVGTVTLTLRADRAARLAR